MADESDPTPADDSAAADGEPTTEETATEGAGESDPSRPADGPTTGRESTTSREPTADEEPPDATPDPESDAIGTTDASYAPALSVDEAVEALESVGREPAEGDAAREGRGQPTDGPSTDGAALVGEALQAALSDAAAGAEALARAAEGASGAAAPAGMDPSIPADVRAYDRFSKMDRSSYDRVNEFLRDRTYVTAREWAIARLCADFRTATGVEMTKIGQHLPELVPFMTDTYSPQAVNQARSAFEGKVRKAGATFLYGAMSGFFTADELDDVMYEVTEVAKFLLEVEGVDLTVDEELAAEERISSVMRDVRRASDQLRHEGVECPECGHHISLAGGPVDE